MASCGQQVDAGDKQDATQLPVQADKLLDSAVTGLESCNSISAKIVHEVYMYDKHLVGSGFYLGQSKGPDYLMRMELRIQLGDQTSSLVQVCDGHFLWTRRKLPDSDRLTRVDVARARAGLQRVKQAGRPGSTGVLPGIGGLPKVFRGLRRTFNFTTVEKGTWGEMKQPVWRLQGQWKPGALAKALPEQSAAIQEGQPADLSKLPQHLPDQVVVFLLAREDPFPFRVEYRRTLPDTLESETCTSRPLVTMELTDVDINLPIDPDRFIYNPGELDFSDETDRFLQSLGSCP